MIIDDGTIFETTQPDGYFFVGGRYRTVGYQGNDIIETLVVTGYAIYGQDLIAYANAFVATTADDIVVCRRFESGENIGIISCCVSIFVDADDCYATTATATTLGVRIRGVADFFQYYAKGKFDGNFVNCAWFN